MATRSAKLADFETNEEPSLIEDLELLCEDHRGTYLLPFPCRRSEQTWWNGGTGEKIEAQVIGWRLWR